MFFSFLSFLFFFRLLRMLADNAAAATLIGGLFFLLS